MYHTIAELGAMFASDSFKHITKCRPSARKMHRLVNVNYLMQNNDTPNVRIDSVQNFRQAAAVIGPINYKPNIRETLQNLNFNFRANSFSSLIRECCVTEGQTLLIFWACRSTDSRVTSMSASSCSSLQIQAQGSGLSQGSGRDRELRSVAQQTDITSCRYPPGGASPGALNGLLTTWMLLKIQEHQVSWRTWRDSTLHVRVTLDAAGDAAGGGAASLTSRASLASHDSFASLATVVGEAAPRADRATNITDPFMVAAPPVLPES
ncbi:unnamed protein product [Leptidea sinapis]|uniref:Uncharacterized protein n=1 Tax=Leptidea sinapis TaxID=189913 RepID=A0A5E4QR24_9NEOP|nr:unnamed protein product [Leptidea sinapis]